MLCPETSQIQLEEMRFLRCRGTGAPLIMIWGDFNVPTILNVTNVLFDSNKDFPSLLQVNAGTVVDVVEVRRVT